ncbi:hypothetical protein [Parasphingopyxis sp.]|uniref:hypothetical protein n=1 Tax=Parasphingopyxis sp. TaxID=1920299 RepID=UPI0026371D27|nr:hypothetical protein [Parasphingopyxis sp.]
MNINISPSPSDYLTVDERIVWSGRPAQGFLFQRTDWFLIPFSIFWAGFVVFWNIEAWGAAIISGESVAFMFALFGIPFLLGGFYFTVGRFVHDAKIRSSQIYVVTDQRVLVFRQRKNVSVQSLDLGHLPVLELSERADGSGTIAFESKSDWISPSGLGIWVPSLSKSMKFQRVANARSVHEQIRRESQRV